MDNLASLCIAIVLTVALCLLGNAVIAALKWFNRGGVKSRVSAPKLPVPIKAEHGVYSALKWLRR
jgi:hypothetical protein